MKDPSQTAATTAVAKTTTAPKSNKLSPVST